MSFNNQNLSSKAMLIKLSISQWNPSKLDKTATLEVQTNHNAQAKTGRYTKNRVSKTAIQPIQKVANSARTFFYENTLPWNDSGFRILPSANFLKCSDGLRQFDVDFMASASEFCDSYQTYINNARNELGTLFDTSDYPAESEIRKAFSFAVEILPLPSAADFRVTLRDSDVKSIQDQITSKLDANIEQANRDLWRRLYDATAHMAAKLKDADAVFRDSLVKNLCELCDLLPALNLTGDPQLEEMRREIEARLCAYDPQALRENPAERKTAATEADAIAQMMSGYMGGPAI